MHKIISALLLTILFTPAANAQNCVNSSRCDELGYTKTTTDCAGLDTLVCPFDENKVFCVFSEKSCEVGDILYENKKCYVKAIDGKTAIGIVFDTEKRLAMALDEATLEWGGYGKEIRPAAALGASGKSNTAAILAYGKTNNISYPAAEYCNSYSTSGTKAGDWFLPSLGELELLSNNFSAVNASLKVLGKPTITGNGYYWSSIEDDDPFAWVLDPSEGIDCSYNKNDSYRVRPVLAF